VWRAYSGGILAAGAVVETVSPRSAKPAGSAEGISQAFAGKTSAKAFPNIRHWTTLEIDEARSNRDTSLGLLLAFARQEKQSTGTHAAVGDVQTESDAIDAAFELHLPLAVSVRAAAM
jgi:hypothetical protein